MLNKISSSFSFNVFKSRQAMKSIYIDIIELYVQYDRQFYASIAGRIGGNKRPVVDTGNATLYHDWHTVWRLASSKYKPYTFENEAVCVEEIKTQSNYEIWTI